MVPRPRRDYELTAMLSDPRLSQGARRNRRENELGESIGSPPMVLPRPRHRQAGLDHETGPTEFGRRLIVAPAARACRVLTEFGFPNWVGSDLTCLPGSEAGKHDATLFE